MKKFYLFKFPALVIFQCAFATLLFAQAPLPKQWDKRFGGDDRDNLYSLQQTTDGGYVLGGTSSSSISGDETEARRGYYD